MAISGLDTIYLLASSGTSYLIVPSAEDAWVAVLRLVVAAIGRVGVEVEVVLAQISLSETRLCV